MKARKTNLLLLLLLVSFISKAQNYPTKSYQTKEKGSDNLTIDGKLDELSWQTANWQDDFIQHEPFEGKAPGQKTEFAILYDDNFIYVGFKAYDTAPDSIVQRMTQRDNMDGDLVGIQFDSYHDKRTAFTFIVSAAGIKTEYIVSNDGDNEDYTWDPIWWVKTSIDKHGWYAEMRIPLSQLRFDDNNDMLWGLQVGRYLFRKDEWSFYQPIAKKQSGWVSHFADLKGLQDIKSKKTMSFTPYVVARTDRFEKEVENPFRSSGKRNKLDAGLDGKLGITKNLTLDFTINPDFGQVEADPSEVNLSTYETFFAEKRPFFIEGKNILSFPLMFGDGSLANENLFYSRRIGRRPHYSPDINDDEYIKSPEFTKILGAAKMTGKTKNGWSVGVLESLTGNEYAKISNGHTREVKVEPLTNYAIGRIQKDINDGNTTIGGMFTAVNRQLNTEDLNFLHKAAYTGGIDFVHKWDNKNWEIDFSSYFSHVEGSTEAIKNTQESWIHGFQRPDASHLTLDTTRTSLTGQGGKIVFGKYGGKLKFLNAIAWKSPGLELNDVGYLREADNIFQVLWVGYRIYEPFSIFRYLNFNFNQWTSWDFGGELLDPGGNINLNTQFKNFWYMSGGFNIDGKSLSTTALRGGSALKVPGSKNIWFNLSTNDQKKFTVGYSMSTFRSNEKKSHHEENFGFDFGYRPSKSLKITISPGYSEANKELQYVTQEETDTGTDYIFARIKQNTLNASIRINYNITPDLSIQYWGQPFIATGKYNEFKRVTDSRANKYRDRFKLFDTDELSYDATNETYQVLNNSGDQLYTFDQPDFNVKNFLSNMVVRWEYSPGSTLYLVWSQTRNTSVADGSFDFNRDIQRLFDEKPYNVFLIKLSYRIGR